MLSKILLAPETWIFGPELPDKTGIQQAIGLSSPDKKRFYFIGGHRYFKVSGVPSTFKTL